RPLSGGAPVRRLRVLLPMFALPALLLLVAAFEAPGQQQFPRQREVVVIAPSVSTSMKAREIRARLHLSETSSFRRADAILVVVRSSLFNPLDSSYKCVAELTDDAEGQLNISGPKFHVYLYEYEDDLSVSQTAHQAFSAEGD